MPIKCPYCEHEGAPNVTTKMNSGGWVLFVVLLLFCLPLCFIPFVVDGCKDEVRKCASCGGAMG